MYMAVVFTHVVLSHAAHPDHHHPARQGRRCRCAAFGGGGSGAEPVRTSRGPQSMLSKRGTTFVAVSLHVSRRSRWPGTRTRTSSRTAMCIDELDRRRCRARQCGGRRRHARAHRWGAGRPRDDDAGAHRGRRSRKRRLTKRLPPPRKHPSEGEGTTPEGETLLPTPSRLGVRSRARE